MPVKSKMFRKLLTIFSIVFLAKHILADCFDLTMELCQPNPPFQISNLESEKHCQNFCSFVYTDTCKFFIYDRPQKECQLFEYDFQEYIDSCDRIALTPTPDFTVCQEFLQNYECTVRSREICIKYAFYSVHFICEK